MARDLPAGTVTFLFTDIEGSTRLLRTLGPIDYAAALAEHRRLLRGAFAAHGGVEVDTQGDAFFVGFPTAAGAAAAALAGQGALDSGPIAVRMGMHTGAPTVTDEGYVGIDVHRGARIAALAHGGQVLLSPATAGLLGEMELRDLGRHRLKDFDAPVRIFQLGAAMFPPLRTPGAVDLPTPATRFVGRESELLEAAGLWLEKESRLLTILGPGGTGKTRFAIELARLIAEEADAGTVFVPLAPVRDAALVVPTIAAHLGASGDDADSVAARVGDRQAHVVLDNLEQLLPGVARPLAALLAAAPSLRVIATSREPVRIAGELEFDLPPMRAAEAVTLFLERGQAVRPDIVDSEAVHELTRRLDGLPLAIELAAARVKLLGPEKLLERLSSRLDILKGGRDADERHSTLRATIAWSYDLLDADEQRLFGRLAIFRGGCTLDEAEAVCDADLDTLASLLDKSLVRRRTDERGEERFWMLETIREFARERLDASGEEDALRTLQTDRLIELADRAGTRAVIDAPGRWDFDVVAPEIDNVRAALAWAIVHDPGRGLQLATWLEAYWVVRDPVEGAAWLERLLTAAPDADPVLRGRGLRALGGVLDIEGEVERARACYPAALELFDAAGEEFEASHMRFRIAANMAMRGLQEEAWPLLDEVLEESRRLGHTLGVSQAMAFLAPRAHGAGDLSRAIELTLESGRLAGEVGWTWWEAGQLCNAAMYEHEAGELDAAEAYARRALELGLEIGDIRTQLFAGAALAAVAADRGDAVTAGRIWGALEGESHDARSGQFEHARAELEALVLRAEGPAFSRARDEGRTMSLVEAAEQGPGAAS